MPQQIHQILLMTLLLMVTPVFGAKNDEAVPTASDQLATELTAVQQFAKTVLDSHRLNNDRLGGVEMTIRTVGSDKTVKETTETRKVLSAKHYAVITQSPTITFNDRAVILDGNIRYERDADSDQPAIYWYDGATWTHLSHGTRAVITRDATVMKGMPPLDPREFVGIECTDRLNVLLARERLENASLRTSEGITTLSTPMENGQRIEIDFSSSHDLLPVASRIFHSNGKLFRDATASYQRIEERSAWLPREVSQRLYPLNETSAGAGSDWNQEFKTLVTGSTLIDKATAENELKPVVPEGFHVLTEKDMLNLLDANTRNQIATKTDKNFSMNVLLYGNLALFGCCGIYWLWQRRKLSPHTI